MTLSLRLSLLIPKAVPYSSPLSKAKVIPLTVILLLALQQGQLESVNVAWFVYWHRSSRTTSPALGIICHHIEGNADGPLSIAECAEANERYYKVEIFHDRDF